MHVKKKKKKTVRRSKGSNVLLCIPVDIIILSSDWLRVKARHALIGNLLAPLFVNKSTATSTRLTSSALQIKKLQVEPKCRTFLVEPCCSLSPAGGGGGLVDGV